MNRFFVVQAMAYESTRLAVDAAVGMPSGETCLAPASVATKTSEGDVLVSVRTEHAEREPYKSAIDGLLQSGSGEEMSEAEWLSMFPPALQWPPG